MKLALFALAVALAPPATTRSADLDRWLDLAGTEIAASADEPDRKGLLSELELAITLVRLRGNESDQRVLREMIQRRRPDPPTADPKLAEFCFRAVVAMASAALGDKDDAKEMALAAAAAAKEARGAKENMFGVIVPAVLTQMWARLGDAEAARAAEMSAPITFGDQIFPLTSLAREFDDAGLLAARDAALADATRMAMEMKKEIDIAAGLRKVAQELIKQQRMGEAIAVIEKMPAEFPRCDVYLDLARAQDAARDKKAAKQSLAAALATVKAMPRSYQELFCPNVARAAAEIGDADVLARAADATERELKISQPNWRASLLANLALNYAAVGDIANMDRLAKSAEAASSDEGADQRKGKSEVFMTLAGAFARAGQKDRALQALKRADEIHRHEDYSNNDPFSQLLTGFVEAGDMPQVVALASADRGFEADDLDFSYEHGARIALRKDNFAAARGFADQITSDSRRVRAYRTIVFAQCRTGHANDVPAWVGKLPHAHTRAILYLAMGQQALGTDHKGWSRSMQLD